MTMLPKAAVFIDGANFYHAYARLGIDVDYRRLRAFFAERYRLTRMSYYAAVERDPTVHDAIRPLVDWLAYNGYTVVTRGIQRFENADGSLKIKGNIDVHLAVDCLDYAANARPDVVVLMTGDGDFVPLVKALQQRGIVVYAVSALRTAPAMIADELRRQVDEFIDVEDLRAVISRDRPAPVRATAVA